MVGIRRGGIHIFGELKNLLALCTALGMCS